MAGCGEYATEGLEVECDCQESEFCFHVGKTPEQESSGSQLLLEYAKDWLDQSFSARVQSLSLLSGHPLPMLSQQSI